jgi:aminoglycoside phosphotransferase (APT) family kinase protein
MDLLERLISSAKEIVMPLQAETHTLLHGDYWPGNIAALPDGHQVVYDWQLASVGPGVMDLLAFIYKSLWWFESLPITTDEIIERYRANIGQQTGIKWEQEEWSRLWDHALMWRFIQEWVDLLAVIPGPLIETWAARLENVWLDPVRRAADRRLSG